MFSSRDSLRGKCPNKEFFLVRISRFRTEYRKIQAIKNYVYGYFLRSDCYKEMIEI